MHIGLFQNVQWPETTEQESQYRNTIEQTLLAEELGFESAFFVEHHWTRHGILSSTLTFLAYLAARTTTLRLGTAVLVLPFHNPARVAEEAATVDVVSNGRLELGVGRGFQWTEFNGFDLPMGESAARFDEALDIILKSWTEPDRFSYEGRYWTYKDIRVEPSPVQRPHPPVWVAAGSKDSLLKVGRLGLKLQLGAGLPLERIPDAIATYKEGLQQGGHAFNPENVLLARMMYVDASKERAWEVAGPRYEWFRTMAASVTQAPDATRSAPPSNPLVQQELDTKTGRRPGDPGLLFCTPDEAIEMIEGFKAMGVGHLIGQDNFGGLPQEQVLASLRLFASEVLPHFAGAGVYKRLHQRSN